MLEQMAALERKIAGTSGTQALIRQRRRQLGEIDDAKHVAQHDRRPSAATATSGREAARRAPRPRARASIAIDEQTFRGRARRSSELSQGDGHAARAIVGMQS